MTRAPDHYLFNTINHTNIFHYSTHYYQLHKHHYQSWSTSNWLYQHQLSVTTVTESHQLQLYTTISIASSAVISYFEASGLLSKCRKTVADTHTSGPTRSYLFTFLLPVASNISSEMMNQSIHAHNDEHDHWKQTSTLRQHRYVKIYCKIWVTSVYNREVASEITYRKVVFRFELLWQVFRLLFIRIKLTVIDSTNSGLVQERNLVHAEMKIPSSEFQVIVDYHTFINTTI